MRKDPKGNALPPRMQYKRGGYYHVQRVGGKPKWTSIGLDYAEALRGCAAGGCERWSRDGGPNH